MSKLQLFAQLQKVDVANRRLHGVIATETPDAQNEIMDYLSSAPHFKEWSENLAKTSGGKNVGNVRAMHGLVAAGHLVELTFDDEAKKILAVAEITDDNEFSKVLKGTYTGFSVGGKYMKKWRDGENTRYTAKPKEVSLVDAPCVPDATFDLVKADGVTESMKFQPPEKHEEVDVFGAVRAELEKIAKRSDTSAKEGESKYGNVEYADATNKKYPIDTPAHIRAAWNYINKSSNAGKYSSGDVASIKKKIVAAWKDKIDKAGPPSAEDAQKCEGPNAEHYAYLDCLGSILFEKMAAGDTKILEGVKLGKEVTRGQVLEKGMYTCQSLCRVLEDLGCVQSSVACEARYEDDGSPLPTDLAAAAKEIGRILVSMVEEEVEELTEALDDNTMALASKPEDLLKAAQDELGAGKLAYAELQKRLDAPQEELKKAQGAISEHNTAFAKVQGEINDLKKTVAQRDLKIEELQKAAKAPARLAVGKGDDVLPGGDVKKVEVVKTGNDQIDASASVIKAIHSRGGQRFG